MSDSLWPLELQHARFPCPVLFPWVCSNLRSLSQWCHAPISSSVDLFTSCPQSSFFSSIRVFSNESALHIRWPKYWSFSFSIRPSKEYSVFISIRIDCFYVLAVHPGGHTLRQQLLKSASKSLWGKDWKMTISVCSLLTEPWSDIWLRSMFATVLLYLWTQVLLTRWSRDVFPGWRLQNQGFLTWLQLALGRLVAVGWPVYDHGGDLERTVVDSPMCVELEAWPLGFCF